MRSPFVCAGEPRRGLEGSWESWGAELEQRVRELSRVRVAVREGTALRSFWCPFGTEG